MNKLSGIKFENLKVGDKVSTKYSKTGKPEDMVEYQGVISELETPEKYPTDWENTISIDWNSGSVTFFLFHSWCDKINYIGR